MAPPQNSVLKNPIKAIYVKPNPGDDGDGIIDNISYINITAEGTLWWPIYVGLQQQHQPHNAGTGCSFFYPLPGTKCPTQPHIPVTNLKLKDITMTKSLLSPGLLRCNASGPCTGWTFDNVHISSLTNFPVSDGYQVENVYGVATNSNPMPKFSGAALPTAPATATSLLRSVEVGSWFASSQPL